jgi:hypothetical protein
MTERAEVCGTFIEEGFGVGDRLVVDGWAEFHEEVVEDEGRLQVSDLLAKFIGEVLSAARSRFHNAPAAPTLVRWHSMYYNA